MTNYTELFNDSYERIRENSEPFFDDFYTVFINKSDEIKNLFANSDMDAQKQMLKISLVYLISFFATRQTEQHLIDIADLHRNRLNVTAEMYEIWLDSLVESLQKHDPYFNQNVEMSWRITLSPGIEFMKHYTR